MPEAKLSSKNQIVIPREAREAFGLKPGDSLLVDVNRYGITITPKPENWEKAIRGLMKDSPYGPGYLKKERKSWKR